MSRDEELPIIRAFYDFVLWLTPKIAKFPRNHRFVLGEYPQAGGYGSVTGSRSFMLPNRRWTSCSTEKEIILTEPSHSATWNPAEWALPKLIRSDSP